LISLGFFSAAPIQALAVVYELLNHNLVSPFLSFARGFEFAIVLTVSVLFLLISVFVALRQLKRLPASYSIQVTDVYGNASPLEGVRLDFKTYEAAASYARFYREQYSQQYAFRVIGIQRRR
jgi:hypothetical protein